MATTMICAAGSDRDLNVPLHTAIPENADAFTERCFDLRQLTIPSVALRLGCAAP
jgi:hypothetical protein